MTDFGDSEPEDAWDADDSVAEQVDNIRRRIRLLKLTIFAVATPSEQERLNGIEDDLGKIIQKVVTGG